MMVREMLLRNKKEKAEQYTPNKTWQQYSRECQRTILPAYLSAKGWRTANL
jgi:hypothetical protein